jgi:hypothetical protein
VTRLLDAFATLGTGLPNAVRDHPLAQRLGRDPDVVVLLELLHGEGRTEVPVALAHKTEDVRLVRLRDPIGCRSAAAFISQARSSVSFKRSQEPPNLPLASAEATCRLGLRHTSLREPCEDRQCVHFSRAQGEEIAGHGPGLNPGPDIYAWEKPDIMAWGLQPNCAVRIVMSTS